ncbi:MAG: M14 family metallopeptidase [Bacteroidota bacterium]
MNKFTFTYQLKTILLTTTLLINIISFGQYKPRYQDNKTPTYDEIIKYYKDISTKYDQAFLFEEGKTDIGKPLHLFVISFDKDFTPESIRNKNKRVVFINNGIHPGESCGIDASLQFATDLLSGKLKAKKYIENTVICIIPVYNIGGALNRGPYSRMNQVGPEEHGFRGNARNLDLNRDFIKNDSENAKSFAKIFHKWEPDVFVDTHTSNGADYQYALTLIATQSDKLNPILAEYMDKTMVPHLYKSMKNGRYEMVPYVQTLKQVPDSGIYSFYDSPRYASGYSTLFNTIGFITETHMLKPYKDRVLSTYDFILNLTGFVNKNYIQLGEIREKAINRTKEQEEFTIGWELDKSRDSSIIFKGFEAQYNISSITGKQRLHYNRSKPFEKPIKYYHHYKAVKTIKKPAYYIIPQAWHEAIFRLKLNGIEFKRLSKDTSIMVTAYFIDDYKTRDAYENHYLHYNIQVHTEKVEIKFYKGDYIIETNQEGNSFIIETLEPEAVDSYFTWNFFDAMIQPKEWMSAYIFEETAEKILKERPELKLELEEAKKKDKRLAENHYWQLYFIYQRSKYFEKSYRRYPVYRLEERIALPTE